MDDAKLMAMQYLEQFIPELVDPFQTSLVAYALSVANSKNRNEAFNRLHKMRRVGRLAIEMDALWHFFFL